MTKFLIGLIAVAATMAPTLTMAQHDHEPQYRGFYDYSTRRYYDYRYGSHTHLERMAGQLWNAANAVCWEAHNNYQHEQGYRETYREMYKMLKDSEHLKRLVHDAQHHPAPGISDHIASDLHELDELMHHVQDDVRRWHRDAHHHHHPHDEYHSGHNHGVDRVYGAGDIKEKLFRMEHTVHHLMEDFGVQSKVNQQGNAPPPDSGQPGPPPTRSNQGFAPPSSSQRIAPPRTP